jgi:hypothetical protein
VSRRRTANTHAQRKRRLPFKAVIEREEVFRTVDSREIEAEAMRLTNGAEFYHGMERRGDRDVHVVCFDSERAAQQMQRWITNSRIAERPAPKFGPSKEEKAALAQAAIKWAMHTGAGRRIIQAWRGQNSLTRAHTEALRALQRYRIPGGGDNEALVMEALVYWASTKHSSWFDRSRHPARVRVDFPDWFIPVDAYAHSEED